MHYCRRAFHRYRTIRSGSNGAGFVPEGPTGAGQGQSMKGNTAFTPLQRRMTDGPRNSQHRHPIARRSGVKAALLIVDFMNWPLRRKAAGV
jgi:hypothetical protein